MKDVVERYYQSYGAGVEPGCWHETSCYMSRGAIWKYCMDKEDEGGEYHGCWYILHPLWQGGTVCGESYIICFSKDQYSYQNHVVLLVSISQQKSHLGKLAKATAARSQYMLYLQMEESNCHMFLQCHLTLQVWDKLAFTLIFLINIFTVLQIVWSGGASKRSHGGSFPHYYFGPYGNGGINIFLRIQ